MYVPAPTNRTKRVQPICPPRHPPPDARFSAIGLCQPALSARQETDGQIICRAIALPGGRRKEIRQYILAIKPQSQKPKAYSSSLHTMNHPKNKNKTKEPHFINPSTSLAPSTRSHPPLPGLKASKQALPGARWLAARTRMGELVPPWQVGKGR